jgi:hypothetical protein
MRSSLVRMRSSLVVRASDCQCTSCNGPGFDPRIRRHSGIWRAADEAVLNGVWKKEKKIPQKIFRKKNFHYFFLLFYVFSLDFSLSLFFLFLKYIPLIFSFVQSYLCLHGFCSCIILHLFLLCLSLRFCSKRSNKASFRPLSGQESKRSY